jgi:hypothetical protein
MAHVVVLQDPPLAPEPLVLPTPAPLPLSAPLDGGNPDPSIPEEASSTTLPPVDASEPIGISSLPPQPMPPKERPTTATAWIASV